MNVYNIVADICSFVIGSCPEEFFVKYSCVSKAERARIRGIVEAAAPSLVSGGRTQKLADGDATERILPELARLVGSLKGSRDFFALAGLAQILDDALEPQLRERTAEFQADDFSVTLNTNREATGIGLLPRCPCVWERKHRLSHSYNRMDNFLFNMLLMENAILGELIDKHFFLRRELFPGFGARRSLKVAATPLRLERPFEIHPYDEGSVQYFRIGYRGGAFEEDNERVMGKILAAADAGCDIVVFPEMLGNPDMAGFVSARIKSLPEPKRERIPSLIILPSYWENRRNTVAILDKFGDVICRQCKQNPFRADVGGSGYLEGISPSQVVNIFHYEGIGRIAVLICKDFLTTTYMEQLMRCFKLTLIIVPSFSTGSYDFRQSFDLCAHDDCNVVWINACAALEKGKERNFENVGYVRKRVGRDADESQRLCPMPICGGAFRGECAGDCLFFETIDGV